MARVGALLERTAVRDWRAVTALFFTSTLLESLALGHLNAFTPLFLRDELRLPPEQVAPWTGVLVAVTFGVAFPLAPFWGALAERYSRKLIIVRSQYLEAVAYLLCALAPSLEWFLAARLLLGLTFGNIAIVISAQALLAPERRIASSISITQTAAPVAVSLGPLLGALFIPWIGLRGVFLLDALLCLTAALLVTFLMPEPPSHHRGKPVLDSMRRVMRIVWARPPLRWNFAGWYLTRGSASVVETYLPVRVTELVPLEPAPAIGLVLGGYGLLTTLFTAVTGRVVDRVGATRMFWPGMLLATGVVLTVALSPWLWLLAVAAWLFSIPIALTSTVLYAHLAQVLARDERAGVMSLTPLPRNVASFSLPLLAAGAATISSGAALLVATAGYGFALWVGWRLRGATSQSDQGPAPTSSK